MCLKHIGTGFPIVLKRYVNAMEINTLYDWPALAFLEVFTVINVLQ